MAAIPQDHDVTGREIWDACRSKNVCSSKSTLYHYLHSLVKIGEVLKKGTGRGGLYRRKAWAEPARLRMPLKSMPIRGIKQEIKTINDLFARIDLEFENAYFRYVRALKSMVENSETISSTMHAHDLFHDFFISEIEPPLSSLAQLVWQKRDSLRITDVNPYVAVFLFRPMSYLTPEAAARYSHMTISEFMALFRNEVDENIKKLGMERTVELIVKRESELVELYAKELRLPKELIAQILKEIGTKQ